MEKQKLETGRDFLNWQTNLINSRDDLYAWDFVRIPSNYPCVVVWHLTKNDFFYLFVELAGDFQ